MCIRDRPRPEQPEPRLEPDPRLERTPELPITTSQSVLYADDDTDNVTDKDPDKLIRKIQHEANLSAAWVADNQLVCSGGKTKLMIIATPAMRRSRLEGKTFQITVCGKSVKATICEKILGVIVNNQLTHQHHMHGDKSDPKAPLPGLISQLSKRVGMLARLVHLVPAQRFKTLTNGLFVSKLLYAIEFYGVTRGTETLRDCDSRYNAFTKSHLEVFQTLCNKVMRLITGHGYDTPVLQLLEDADMLSINQLIHYTTLMTCFKVKKSAKPIHIAQRLGFLDAPPAATSENKP